jgi:hypothetical protein
MATSKKLKAWVRYDGQNKIVPSSLILQANKPKVGTWKEISTDLCCPICPQLICTRYRNDNPQLEVIFEAIRCASNSFAGDIELYPGESACVQIVSGFSAPFTNLGDCGCP